MHVPVLLNEVLDWINLEKNQSIVDATFGGGGHAEAILKLLGEETHYYAFDQDFEVLEESKKKFQHYKNFEAIHSNYEKLEEILNKKKVKADVVLIDLGVSSFQIDSTQRGFSFKSDAVLDMRMDTTAAIPTAADLLNESSESDLADIFYYFGEERFARRIAKQIILYRRAKAFSMTSQLIECILKATPPKYKAARIHPATRSFQALRIKVNRELEVLEKFFKSSFSYLNEGAKILIISFHSLEDRIVKHAMREHPLLKVLTKKPICPSEAECIQNPRARSAKLRVATFSNL